MRRLKLVPVILLLLFGAACGEAENNSPGSGPGEVNQQEESEPLEDDGMGGEGTEDESETEEGSEEPAEDTGEGAEENDDGY